MCMLHEIECNGGLASLCGHLPSAVDTHTKYHQAYGEKVHKNLTHLVQIVIKRKSAALCTQSMLWRRAGVEISAVVHCTVALAV